LDVLPLDGTTMSPIGTNRLRSLKNNSEDFLAALLLTIGNSSVTEDFF